MVLATGSAANTSLRFGAMSAGSGIYNNFGNEYMFYSGGSRALWISGPRAIFQETSTVGAPALTFGSDLDTGIFRPAANEVAISAAGATAAVFNSSGIILPQLSNTLLSVNSLGQIIATSSTGGSQTLAQTLALGNNVGTYSIIGTSSLRLNVGASSSSFGSVLTLTENEVALNSGGVPGGPWYGSGLTVGTSSISFTAVNGDINSSSIQLYDGGIYLNGIGGTGSSFLTISQNGYIGSTTSVASSSTYTSTAITTTGSNTTIASISFGTYSVYSVSADIIGYDSTNKLSYGAKAFGVFENNGTTYSIINTSDITEKTTFATATSDIILGTSSISIVVSGEPSKTINWKTDYTYTRN